MSDAKLIRFKILQVSSLKKISPRNPKSTRNSFFWNILPLKSFFSIFYADRPGAKLPNSRVLNILRNQDRKFTPGGML